VPLNSKQSIADWQLPPGVSRATWDYINDAQIATQYDSFHASHGLLDYDQRIVAQYVDQLRIKPSTVIDLGCGTGRSLLYPHAQGHQVIGVDLSEQMLEVATTKLIAQCLNTEDRNRIRLLHANMVDLRQIDDHSVDLAFCLYSSFGMLRGREHRLKCLSEVRRTLRANASFLLHVHNRTNWWTTSNGRGLIWHDVKQRIFAGKQHEPGDRYYAYRNLPQMYLHIFNRRELRSLLKAAQMQVKRWIYLDQSSTHELRKPWFFPQLRSAGFLIEAIALD
jgi:ubiquinone/menaquinone biosynthesis C-methylase UbiE